MSITKHILTIFTSCLLDKLFRRLYHYILRVSKKDCCKEFIFSSASEESKPICFHGSWGTALQWGVRLFVIKKHIQDQGWSKLIRSSNPRGF